MKNLQTMARLCGLLRKGSSCLKQLRRFSSGESISTTPAVIHEEFGEPENVLKGVSMNIPAEAKGNEVYLKMLMAPINPSDINMIQGTYMLKPKLPAVVGNEGVGTVIEVEENKALESITTTPAVIHEEFGEPENVLKGVSMNIPAEAKGNEVYLKMLMAPINPSDINMIQGTYMLKPKLPAVVGNEGVGRVIQVGENVKDFKEGDLAIPANPGTGTWCGHLLAKESALRKIDSDIPILSAATLAVNPCTAYRMLKDFKALKPGDVVIQNAANSAVGQSVIQIAKAWGFKTINIVRNRENFRELESSLKDLGADVVVTEEFCRSPAMKDLIKDFGQIPTLALNGVGGKSATELLRALDNKGVIVTYGGMSRQPVIVPTGVFIFKEIIAAGYWNSQWNYDNIGNPEKDQMFNDLFQMIRTGKLAPPASRFYELQNFQAAVKSAMDGYQSHKKVLVMDKELHAMYSIFTEAKDTKDDS